jgi:hypothetical protein
MECSRKGGRYLRNANCPSLPTLQRAANSADDCAIVSVQGKAGDFVNASMKSPEKRFYLARSRFNQNFGK